MGKTNRISNEYLTSICFIPNLIEKLKVISVTYFVVEPNLMKMAGNEGEGRRLNRLLQIAREQEDINRQLKDLGMYDDSSFEERKQLLDAVKESEQFAGIADTGKQSQFTSRSQSRQDGILSRKKPFRLLDSEDSDPDDFEMKGEKTIPSPKLVSSLEKPNNTNVSPSPNVKEHVKLSTDSYAGKVLAASLKKNTTSGKLRSPTLLLQRIDKPKFCNAEKVEELLLHSDSSSESPIFVSSIESRSPKLVAVEVSNPSQKSNTNQIKKSKLVAMKSTAKKYSKLL